MTSLLFRPFAEEIEAALERSAVEHDRLCPRQILGVRMGFAGATALGRTFSRDDRGLLAIVETDGCFADGVGAATGCSMGHRTMRLEDCGRIAATFIDIVSGRAIRVAPRLDVRERAAAVVVDEPRRYYAQLRAYREMPDDDLLQIQEVGLQFDLTALLGQKGVRVDCVSCGEEVVNGREQYLSAGPTCPACAGDAYYRVR